MKNLLKVSLIIVLVFVACLNFTACNNEKYQVTKEEYETAFSMEALSNVTISIREGKDEKGKVEYFYSQGKNYALCRYNENVQYYGRYYGELNGEAFCYLYGHEQVENFTQELAVWEKVEDPSSYAYQGVNFAISYKTEFSFLKYDSKEKAYVYVNSAYGPDIVYKYYFVNKKLTKYTVQENNYSCVCEFYNYGETVIPVKI